MYWYLVPPSSEEKKELSQKVIDYVASEFSYQKTIDLWHDTLNDTLENWKSNYQRKFLGEIK